MQKYRFNFTLPLTIAFLITFSILIKLGFWQLERADHKKYLNESYKLRQSEKIIDLNAHKNIKDKESILWRKVSLNGSFYKEKNLMVDNQIFKHEAGFNILTPFKLDGTGMTILVNRGWHKNLINREQIPVINSVDDIGLINGYAVKIPVPGINLGGSNIEIINASLARFQRINLDEINSFYQANFLPYMVYLNPLIDDEYISNFKLPVPDSEKNYGYAFQWFAFALTLLIIFLRLGIIKNDKPTK
jgi:surfeit locus 1 family protein